MEEYKAAGLDFLRMDFVELGALEGVHYRKGATGMQAYNEGMRYIAELIGETMQINLAISPIFPYQYAHSRRISCDVNFTIRNTEYQLNSLAYGWWLDRLYSFNDPGNVAFEPKGNPHEARSRVNAAAICSGEIVNVNDLTKPEQQAMAKAYLTNPGLMALARKGVCFRPVEGDTGSLAPDVFVWRDGDAWYLAFFNYSRDEASKKVSLARAGMDGSAAYSVTDVWSGEEFEVSGALTNRLAGCESKVFRISR
jgi:hypothetical protein